MKIAFISYEFPPDTAAGGIATYIKQAADMLQNRGNLVEVFTASRHRSGVETETNGLIVHRIKIDNRKNFSHQIAPVFAERHKAVAFDVLEGPDFGAEAIEAVQLVPDIPFVVKLHTPCCILRQQSSLRKKSFLSQLRAKVGAIHQFINPYSIENAERSQALKADVIAAPSNAIFSRLMQFWKLDSKKVHVFPYPYNPSSELLNIKIKRTTSKNITFIGRLEQRKGVLDLAQAIPHILSQCPDAKFRFVGKIGPSPDRDKTMKQYIEEYLHPYCQSIEFTGAIPNNQIHSVLSQTDVCVFPSLFDSFGIVCLEAMSAGRAVVGSSAGGMAEVINSNAVGRLAPPKSPDQIAQKVIELLQNPKLRMQIGIDARERVLEEYTTDLVGDLQEKSYQHAIETRRNLGPRSY